MDDVQPLIDALARRGAPGEAVIFPAVSHNLKPVARADRSRDLPGRWRPPSADKLAGWLRFAAGRLIAPGGRSIIPARTEETHGVTVRPVTEAVGAEISASISGR